MKRFLCTICKSGQSQNRKESDDRKVRSRRSDQKIPAHRFFLESFRIAGSGSVQKEFAGICFYKII
ncbi:MAG: hypothetical protein Q4A75_00040 [Peptostreptococcaceae bacterium]|nr:hypothetical protein [Peptostreptococcaceae bacterium]